MRTQPTIIEIGEERRERFRANARRNWMRVLKPQTLFELDMMTDLDLPEVAEAACEKSS